VRTLLGSPPAIGKFQGAIAMSNLGGGKDLGLTSNYGTTYSSYLTIEESYREGTLPLLNATKCTAGTVNDQISCLKSLNVSLIDGFLNVPRFVVQDGTIVNTEDLDVYNRNGSAAYVPVMFGICANEGASFSTYPKTPVLNESAGIQAALGINASAAQAIIDSGLFPYYDTGNVTLDSFNVSQRVATDNTFRCIDQATMYAGAVSGAFPATYSYQSDRTWGTYGYNPNNLTQNGNQPMPGYPLGDPYAPYFRVHSSDLPYTFGNLAYLRDQNDLYALQLVTGYFAEFVKTGQPNPSPEYLKVRAYTKTLEAVENSEPWEKVSSDTGPMRHLDYPSFSTDFGDLPQCAFLNYSISYYLEGGM
jgi:carboxylesterase type B